MKVKFKGIFILMLVLAMIFTSCNNEVAPQDETGSVTFTGLRTMRSLTGTYQSFDKENITWYYTAEKTDGTGLDTGAQATPTLLGGTGEITSQIQNMSVGTWNFTLYGCVKSENPSATIASDDANLVYVGEESETIVKGDNTVSITVKPRTTENGKGILKLENISIAKINSETVGVVANQQSKVTIYNASTNSPVTIEEGDKTEAGGITTISNIKSGRYRVNYQIVAVGNPAVIYAEADIYVSIFDHLTTTITGTLDENSGNVTFAPDEETRTEISGGLVEVVKESPVVSDKDTIIGVKSSPINQISEDDSTIVIFPSGSIDAGIAKLKVVPYSVDTANAIFSFSDLNGVVGALDLELEVNGNSIEDFYENKEVTVTTFIQPNLTDVEVVYKGEKEGQPTGIDYNSETGELTFKTTHFSQFFVTARAVAYIVGKSDVYKTVSDAFSAMADSNNVSIKLISDSEENGGIRIHSEKKVELDLNGYKYIFVDNENVTNATGIINNGSLHIKNGEIIAKGTTLRLFINNTGDMIVENTKIARESSSDSIALLTTSGNVSVKGNSELIGGSNEHNGVICIDRSLFGYVNDSVLVIFDENFSGNVSGKISYCPDGSESPEKFKLEIKNGTFKGFEISSPKVINPHIFISGGKFSTDPSDYVAEGYKTVENSDGYFEVSSIFDCGDGSESNPFEINSVETLKTFRDDVNKGNTYAGKFIELTRDITLNDDNWTPIGKGERSGNTVSSESKVFSGTFDGKGHDISNLKLSEGTEDEFIGFFGAVSGGTIRNFILSNVNINSTSSCVGSAAGFMEKGSIAKNITTLSGEINALQAGGIIGRMTISGEITGCENNLGINATNSAGGIVGKVYYSEKNNTITISDCTNKGNISVEASGYTGGIVGLAAAEITNCNNTGNVTAKENSSSISAVGGIVGQLTAYGKVDGCTNSGNIINGTSDTSSYGLGGIVGWVRYNDLSGYKKIEQIVISNNTNTGDVTGDVKGVGGIIGMLFNTGMVSGNKVERANIIGNTFVSGIVGGIQKAPDNAFSDDEEVKNTRIINNSIDNVSITGESCTNAFIYNNPTELIIDEVNIKDNTALNSTLNGSSI